MAIPESAEIAAEQRPLNEPLYQAVRSKMVELIQGLQAAGSPEQYMTVHREALVEFGGRQEAIRETLPHLKTEAAAQIRALGEQDPKPIDQIIEQQRILDRARRLKRVAGGSPTHP